MSSVVGVKKALVLSLLLLSGVAAPAAASSIFWSSVTVRLGEDCPLYTGGLPGNGCQFLRTGGISQTLGAGIDTVGPYTATFFPANGFATASVVDGTLHASAMSGTASDPLSTVGLALAVFYDTFVPVSATLAPGTPVTFAFDQQLSYTLAGGGCGTNGAQVAAYVFLNENFSNWVRQTYDHTCSGLHQTGTGIVQGFIGQEFSIRTELSALTFAQALQTSADAGNSFRLVVTPLGDYGFTTASGNTYQASPASVPEPSSLGLLGLGLLAIARRCRHRLVGAE